MVEAFVETDANDDVEPLVECCVDAGETDDDEVAVALTPAVVVCVAFGLLLLFTSCCCCCWMPELWPAMSFELPVESAIVLDFVCVFVCVRIVIDLVSAMICVAVNRERKRGNGFKRTRGCHIRVTIIIVA